MEKCFILVWCKELDDQWECDADRSLDDKLYTLEEVREKHNATMWHDRFEGENFNTKEEAKASYEEYVQDCINHDGEPPEESFEDIFCKVLKNRFECYEIDLIHGELSYRDDLSTYES